MKAVYKYMIGAVAVLVFALGGGGCNSAGDRIVDETGAPAAWALLPFSKVDSANPVLTPGVGRFTDPILHKDVSWEEKDVFNPAVVVKDGVLYLLYRAQDKTGRPAGTSRIGLAVSSDGLHFSRSPAPVLYPDADSLQSLEWEGGCEDPRIAEDEQGTYYMTYTAFDGRLARLLLDWGRSASNGKPEIRFTMALTHEEIANMAGTSRETVTRLLNQFRRDQWISIKGASMTIVQPDQLERLTA